MVNKKYYVTGGIGSGETSEGFGPNYSLRNEAYCETCSSCGVVFFQYKLNLAITTRSTPTSTSRRCTTLYWAGVALRRSKLSATTNPLSEY